MNDDAALADGDRAAHGRAEPAMLADEAGSVEGEAFRLRLVAEPEGAEIEPPGLSPVGLRSEMRDNRAIGIPQPGRRGIEIAAGIRDPILAVDGELDRELIVMGLRAAPAMADRAATNRQ